MKSQVVVAPGIQIRARSISCQIKVFAVVSSLVLVLTGRDVGVLIIASDDLDSVQGRTPAHIRNPLLAKKV